MKRLLSLCAAACLMADCVSYDARGRTGGPHSRSSSDPERAGRTVWISSSP